MRSLVLMLTSLIPLAGCAQPAATSAVVERGPSLYDCAPIDPTEGAAPPRHRLAALRGDPQQKTLLLTIEKGQQQQLDLVPSPPGTGTSAKVFANRFFAWRIGSGSGVLTDVGDFATYSCHGIGNLATSEGSLRPIQRDALTSHRRETV